MNKCLLLMTMLLLVSLSEDLYPEPMNMPADVKNAFAKAGIPLLREKRPIKDFTLKTLEGRDITLSQLKGKVVFLNFWATWCPPCREEMPSMEVLYQRYRNEGLELVAVDIMESSPAVQAFLKEYAYTFPVVLDVQGGVGNQYGIQALPTTLIIDRDNTIICSAVGSRNWNSPRIYTALEELLKYGQ